MQIPFQKYASIFLILKKIQNKINRLRYNTKISFFDSIENPHCMCFASSSLPINKVRSIIAIQYVDNKWFAGHLKNFYLPSVFIENLIKFEVSRYFFRNFELYKLFIIWISKCALPNIWILGCGIEHRVILFFIEWGSYSYKHLHIFLILGSFLLIINFIIA